MGCGRGRGREHGGQAISKQELGQPKRKKPCKSEAGGVVGTHAGRRWRLMLGPPHTRGSAREREDGSCVIGGAGVQRGGWRGRREAEGRAAFFKQEHALFLFLSFVLAPPGHTEWGGVVCARERANGCLKFGCAGGARAHDLWCWRPQLSTEGVWEGDVGRAPPLCRHGHYQTSTPSVLPLQWRGSWKRDDGARTRWSAGASGVCLVEDAGRLRAALRHCPRGARPSPLSSRHHRCLGRARASAMRGVKQQTSPLPT